MKGFLEGRKRVNFKFIVFNMGWVRVIKNKGGVVVVGIEIYIMYFEKFYFFFRSI